MPSNPLPRLALVLALLTGPLTLAQAAAAPSEIAALRAKAEKGNSIAQYNLGLAYASGRDVTGDLPEAYVWLTLAAENGTTGRALQNVLDQMSPAQLAEGKRRLAQQRSASGPAKAETEAPAGTSSEQKALSTELASSWKEADSLKASLAEARAARDSALAELSAASTELASLRATVAKLKNENAPSPDSAQLQRELAETKAAAATLSTRSQELEDIAAQRGRALAEAQAALNEAKARLAQPAAPQAAAPSADSAHLSAELNAVRDEVAKLKADNETLNRRLSAAKSSPDEADMEARLMQATGKRLEAEERAKRAEEALQKAQDQLAAAPAAGSSQGPSGELSAQLADLQARLEREQAAHTDAESHAQQLARDLADARSQLDAAKNAAPTPAAEPPADRSELEDVQAKLSTALRSYTLLQQENDKLKGSSDQLAAQVAALEDQLASSQHDTTAARAAATEATQAADTAGSDLKQQLASLQAELDSQRAAHAAAESRVQAQADTLREQLRQTQDQLNAVRLENGDLRTRLAIIAPPPASTLAAPTRPGTASAATALTAPAAPATTPAAAPMESTPAPTDAAASAGPRTHTVVAGDTLSKIAREYYGTSLRWAEIYEANREQLPNERALAVGMKLVIP